MKKLPPHTKYYFEQFNQDGAAWSWHPNDVDRFIHFVHAAHQGRTKLSEMELKELLIERGFGAKTAEDLAGYYNFGRRLLKRKPAFNYIRLKRNRG